jgi:hypothetical protein
MSVGHTKSFNPLLARYLASLEKNPLRTKAATTGEPELLAETSFAE